MTPGPGDHLELIGLIKPNEHGWFFPWAKDLSKQVNHNTLYSFIWWPRERNVFPVVPNWDPRRTWKTLAGKAGVSKQIAPASKTTRYDISSKTYDCRNYMPVKREPMERWDKFIRAILAKRQGRRDA
ncbi:hypothetical protein [Nitratireductor luteus]|uniref:hypothetical protein n=1 Tax=Nitratireductor luteus TaxID=2976980 RepID=UPI00223F9124|nr:hypothetical protein [Nitratireductor luteus]